MVGLEDDLEDFRILAISDLNGRRFGDEQSALLRTINNLDYDAVFFLGDMVGAGGDPEPFYELLDGLAGTDMYFICGDSDPGPYVDTPRDITGTLSQIVLEDWILGAIERGATYVDSPVRLDVGESTIWIAPSTLLNVEAGEFLATWQSQMEQEEEGVLAGLQVDYDTLPVTSYRQRIAQNFYNAFSAMEDGDFYLSLAHQVPSDDILRAAASHSSDEGRYLGAPELVLAGHYCGGVWRLPLLGAFYIPDDSMPRNTQRSTVGCLRAVDRGRDAGVHHRRAFRQRRHAADGVPAAQPARDLAADADGDAAGEHAHGGMSARQEMRRTEGGSVPPTSCPRFRRKAGIFLCA